MTKIKTLLLGIFFIGLKTPIFAQEKIVATFSVNTGNSERKDTPISTSLESIDFNPDNNYQLIETTSGKQIAVNFQIENTYPPRIWWILAGSTSQNQERTYQLVSENVAIDKEVKVGYDKEDKSLVLYKGNQKVLQYNHAITPPPDGASDLYQRSGYIHPLWSPAGFPLTTIHPDDHIHHMGIWNPWTKTLFEGRAIDFWNLNKGEGTVRFAKYISHYEGSVFGGFQALHEHVDLTAPTPIGSKVALNEVWDLRVFSVGKNYTIVDFISTLNCASNSPIVLEEYRYAGFGYRATEKWKVDNSQVLTSEGKNRAAADATSARWCRVSGESDTGQSGIIFMSHPSNRAHPEPMRVWPLDANNGRGDLFFQFCPIRHADWPLETGKNYVLKYRMYVFDGQVNSETAERLWQDFAHPPQVRIEIP